MIVRSVPFYEQVQRTLVDLAVSFATEESRIFDLGCSLGTTSIEIALRVSPSIHVIGIDSSEEMVAAARDRATCLVESRHITFQCADITKDIEFHDASVVILSLTLQFLPPMHRLPLLRRICNAIQPGGVVLVLEKTVLNDENLNSLFIQKYHDFKRANGYSDLEIARKRRALENVLIPFTIEKNMDLLKEAGFSSVTTFFQWYNFAAFLACRTGACSSMAPTAI